MPTQLPLEYLMLASVIAGPLTAIVMGLLFRPRKRRRNYKDIEYMKARQGLLIGQRKIDAIDGAMNGSEPHAKVLRLLTPGKHLETPESLGDSLLKQAIIGEGLFKRKSMAEEMAELRLMMKSMEDLGGMPTAKERMLGEGIKAAVGIFGPVLANNPAFRPSLDVGRAAMEQAGQQQQQRALPDNGTGQPALPEPQPANVTSFDVLKAKAQAATLLAALKDKDAAGVVEFLMSQEAAWDLVCLLVLTPDEKWADVLAALEADPRNAHFAETFAWIRENNAKAGEIVTALRQHAQITNVLRARGAIPAEGQAS